MLLLMASRMRIWMRMWRLVMCRMRGVLLLSLLLRVVLRLLMVWMMLLLMVLLTRMMVLGRGHARYWRRNRSRRGRRGRDGGTLLGVLLLMLAHRRLRRGRRLV